MSTIKIILISVLLSSCTTININNLEWVLTADPQADAISSVRDGDNRLIGIAGILEQFNRVPLIDTSCKYGKNVKYLQMDDVIDSYKEEKSQAIAPVYAKAYNYHLINHLKSKNISVCNS